MTDFERDFWTHHLLRYEQRYRYAFSTLTDCPDPVLLLMDSRQPGRGRDAALRLLRRDNPDGLDDEALFHARARSGIFSIVTSSKVAAFDVGADLFTRAGIACVDPEPGVAAWVAIVGPTSAALASIVIRPDRSYLQGARFTARALS